MVRTDGKKLIIEIDLDEYENGAETIQNFQGAILEAITMFNYKDFGMNPPFYYLLELYKATLPTLDQQKAILEPPTTPKKETRIKLTKEECKKLGVDFGHEIVFSRDLKSN